MPGTDTSRGINFQYASAIHILLEMPLNPTWQIIQLEGENDIEDILIFDQQDQIIKVAQIKQKSDPHQWKPVELKGILQKFYELSASDNVEYEFIYAGSEGKGFHQIHNILLKLSSGGQTALDHSEQETLNKALGTELAPFLVQLRGRPKLIRTESRESLEARDFRTIQNFLRNQRHTHVHENTEENIYRSLFHLIAQKTEQTSKYSRRLSREEVCNVLGIVDITVSSLDLVVTEYLTHLTSRISQVRTAVSLDLQEEMTRPEILRFVTEDYTFRQRKEQTALSLSDIVRAHRSVVIVGKSGSGKTYALWQLASHYSEQLSQMPLSREHPLPVFIDLAGYDGEPIIDLLQQAFLAAGQSVTTEALEFHARQGHFLLLLDDADMARADKVSDLMLYLKRWNSVRSACRVVLATHRPSDGHNLLLPTFQIQSVTYEQAKQLLTMVTDIETEHARAILHSFDRENSYLITSPLTLQMLASVYLQNDQHIPLSRGMLYDNIVRGMVALGERKGLCNHDQSDKMGVLSLLARWMQDQEIYSLSPAKLSSLMTSWFNDQEQYPQVHHLLGSDQLSLRNELLQSGVLYSSTDGAVTFLHPSFRAYFATLTLSVDELPHKLEQSSWQQSLIFWASLRERHETDSLVDLLVDNPLLLGSVLSERAEIRTHASTSNLDIQLYFEQFYWSLRALVPSFQLRVPDTEIPQMLITPSKGSGYTIVWQCAAIHEPYIDWVELDDIPRVLYSLKEVFPLPIWLVPDGLIEMYHPTELAYIWTMRFLFDDLVFYTWSGGLEGPTVAPNMEQHPAIIRIFNQYVLFWQMAQELHPTLRVHLPFDVNQYFILAVELIKDTTPQFVRFATVSAPELEAIDCRSSEISEASDEMSRMFTQLADGSWKLRLDNQEYFLATISEDDVPNILDELAGHTAQKWLKQALEHHVPAFPPINW